MAQGADILMFSFGGARTFRVRNARTKEHVIDVETKDAGCIIMRGRRFQEDYTHEIVPTSKDVSRRLCITVRKFVSPAHTGDKPPHAKRARVTTTSAYHTGDKPPHAKRARATTTSAYD